MQLKRSASSGLLGKRLNIQLNCESLYINITHSGIVGHFGDIFSTSPNSIHCADVSNVIKYTIAA